MRRTLLYLTAATLLVPPVFSQGTLFSGTPVKRLFSPGTEQEGPTPPTIRASSGPLEQDGNGECKHPSISPCGRFVVFESDSSNLGPTDTNLQRDIYLRDRDSDENGIFDEPGTCLNVLVSLTSSGLQASLSNFDPSVSDQGRHVAFTSVAANMVFGDTNGVADIMVRDRDADGDGIYDEPGESTTVRVSVSSTGVEANAPCSVAKVSADGRTVVFESTADNLYTIDGNGVKDVFFHDRDPDGNGFLDEGNGVTIRASSSTFGQAGNDVSSGPVVSADGRFIAFESRASDLVVGDTNGFWDVFVYDRDPDENGIYDEANAVIQRVSLGPAGIELNGDTRRPHLNPDARHVVFESEADNLGTLDPNGEYDVYARDRDPDGNGILDEGNETNTLISITYQGFFANGDSIWGRVSNSGRYVAYVSFARNLSPLDTNFTFDVFARDRDPDGNGILDEGNGVTHLLSRRGGEVGDMLSGNGEISGDGRWKAFASDATNLNTYGDQNGLRDIYVRRIF